MDALKRQGSIRKVFPSTTNGDSVLGMSAKMIERPQQVSTTNGALNQSYAQFFQEYSIMSEYNMLIEHYLPGLYVVPSATNALVWFGVLFVRKGLYQGGVFRFKLLIPEGFPDSSCPCVVFECDMFHPGVSEETGEMNLSSVFPEWRKDVNRLWQALEYVVNAFSSIQLKSTLNSQAALIYEENQSLFIERVKKCVEKSLTSCYNNPTNDDPHYLKFEAYDSQLHAMAKQAILTNKVGAKDTLKQVGLSWVQPGSLEPFSRQVSATTSQ